MNQSEVFTITVKMFCSRSHGTLIKAVMCRDGWTNSRWEYDKFSNVVLLEFERPAKEIDKNGDLIEA